MDSSRGAGKVLSLLAAVTFVLASVSAQTPDTGPALIQAIQRGDCAAASRLIADGTSPNVKDDDSVPALMLATLFADVADAWSSSCNEGADPNQADSVGATALMWAMPDIEKARVLLKHGANVNARSTILGRTPFLIAAASPGTFHSSICCSRKAPTCGPRIRRGSVRWPRDAVF